MQKAVELVKASAGAGKTHFLTQRYIDLLLEGGEDSYKHILAVTFTNKATEEMKSRIVERLSEMASDAGDPRSEKAGRRLTRILHDYSSFSICTIDSFFQTVMRAFAREIGQYASYRVELDQGAVLSQAVDMMLDSLGEEANSDLLEWLKEFSFRQIQEGKSWNMKGPLEELSSHFFKEDFKLKIRRDSTAFQGDRNRLRELDENLGEMISGYENEGRRIGSGVLEWLREQSFRWDDFKGKSKTKIRLFEKWARGIMETAATNDLYDSLAKMAPDAYPQLRNLIAEAIALSEREHRRCLTAAVIRKNLYLLGIYSDLYKHLNTYLSENNVVLLGETTDLLSRIIDGNDTPFIYEKIGNRFDHIMLDESQDTSVLQWDNFKPLFNESVAKGCSNLIVGDIKQSIYRWRGSDWRLISDYVYRDLGRENIEDYSSSDNPLSANWRSGECIVGFNNDLFSKVSEYVALEKPEAGEEIGRIYSGCTQKIPEERKNVYRGRVKIGFVDIPGGEDWKAEAMRRMLGDIREMLSAGYTCKDITVLVRKNSEGADVAQFLIDNGYDVMTEDSLLVSSSECVQRIINRLSCKADPDSPASRLLSLQGIEAAEGAGCSLYGMCENMIASIPGGVAKRDVPFVNAFLDCVLSYQDKYGSSLRGFVKYWEESGEKKSICAPKGRNAIRVMTIHKSKGLSLDAVIVPFLDEPFSPRGNIAPTVWCRAENDFPEAGIVPVKICSGLENTSFKEDYDTEKKYEYVDVINTVYVAFTRARSQLTVYAKAPSKRNDFRITSFANLLFKYCSERLDEDDTMALGTLEKFESEKETVEGELQNSFAVVPLAERLKVSTQWEDYFNPDVSPRMKGIAYHDILSKVDREEDLEKACGADGDALGFLSSHMKAVSGRHWFDGTFVSLNEASIILADGSVERPDRVLVDESASSAIVIDYKFGRPLQKHREQVARYCGHIRSMGFSAVSGYLWYVERDSVEQVC